MLPISVLSFLQRVEIIRHDGAWASSPPPKRTEAREVDDGSAT
jgi:hypothetical protein